MECDECELPAAWIVKIEYRSILGPGHAPEVVKHIWCEAHMDLYDSESDDLFALSVSMRRLSK